MKLNQVAAITYTIREYTKTPASIAESMKKLAEIGFEAVQISGTGPIEIKELKTILDGEGLKCCATHENPQALLDDPAQIIEKLEKLDCPYTSVPSPGQIPVGSAEAIKAFAKRMNDAGKLYQEAGITLTYHNHHFEFRRFGEQTMLDLIYDETDARYLQGELDTYWCQFGGGNPASWCQRLKGRLPLLHLKDYIITEDFQPTYAEIGYGNLEWPAIIEAAELSGCKWFIIEQDETPGDPFDSLKKSFDYIKQNLVQA